ncbi:XRE family transcriptional regulator [Actinomadura spongiicola]|uniref:XRE family transcriptional regulator n=1 Tax=Actinomadura spongiicola TaxID=2303421 RepID=A0A372GLT2_9ACTN|nr:helix-turn-helix transcriptional regulator [Actinomadura spongiicola]RFS86344.1 XRE family transcriptional regulator [Actinomadura spongiicola]
MALNSENKMQVDPELVGFAREFKRRREAAGLNQAELARQVNVARSYISHVERARTRCRRDFTIRVDKALNANGELVKTWDELLEKLKTIKYPAYFVDFPKAEVMADMLRGYETMLVYGLFQTDAYARFLLPNEEDFQSRMRRQEILKRNPPPVFSVVMDETVLYREIDSPKTMTEQLEYLIELSLREEINIQIAPLAYYRGVRTSFTVATLPDMSMVVVTDKAYGGETSTRPEDLKKTTEAFVTLQAEALSAKESRALIRKVIDERWT